MQLTLNNAERELLTALLQTELRDVRSENYHAESHQVKVGLRDREARVRGLLERLAESGGDYSLRHEPTDLLEAEAEAALSA